jgi:DNA-binding NarL/FixJ family response regulator
VSNWIEREALSRILEVRARCQGCSIDVQAGDQMSSTAEILIWDGIAPEPATDAALIMLAEEKNDKSHATAADWRENPQKLLDMFARMLDHVVTNKAAGAARPQRRLTQRQEDVLNLIGQGFSNGQIATALGMSENTVRIHVSAIFKTLGVRNRTQAALLLRQAA